MIDLQKAVEEVRKESAQSYALKSYEQFLSNNPQLTVDPLDKVFPNKYLYPIALLTTASMSFALGAGFVSAASFNLVFLAFFFYFFTRVIYRIYRISTLTRHRIQYLRKQQDRYLDEPPDSRDLLEALKNRVLPQLSKRSDKKSLEFKKKIEARIQSMEELDNQSASSDDLETLEQSLEALLDLVKSEKETRNLLTEQRLPDKK